MFRFFRWLSPKSFHPSSVIQSGPRLVRAAICKACLTTKIERVSKRRCSRIALHHRHTESPAKIENRILRRRRITPQRFALFRSHCTDIAPASLAGFGRIAHRRATGTRWRSWPLPRCFISSGVTPGNRAVMGIGSFDPSQQLAALVYRARVVSGRCFHADFTSHPLGQIER